MHLAFIDFITAYDASRPDQPEPLGGTTSAVCFLARELVKTGVDCSLYNRVGDRGRTHGVFSAPLHALGHEIERGTHDAYIFCGRWSRELVELVRSHTKVPLVAWMHESALTPPLTPALDAFDGIVYVSEWQKRVNQADALPKWRQTVIRNAMNPVVAASFPPWGGVLTKKVQPPILLFAGHFARGAFHVAPLLDKVRPLTEAHPQLRDFSVEIYCNLTPSHNQAQDEAYIAWLRGQPNITHVGMVGQQELARRMRRASVFIAPNPWPETSCIALIEALASGLSAVTTARAALSETAAGFARHVPIDLFDDRVRFDMPIDYDAFAAQVLDAMLACIEHPVQAETSLRRQIDYFQANYQWSQRTMPWIEFINSLSK